MSRIVDWRRTTKTTSVALAALALLLSGGGCLPAGPITEEGPPRVRMQTSLGEFVIELNDEESPLSVENFLCYVEDGFYTGTLLHRVIPNFVIQGGGYTPGLIEKTDTRGPIVNESRNGLRNEQLTVSMARTVDPDSARSQFFINLVDNPSLDATLDRQGYAVFGRIIDGQAVISAIGIAETQDVDGFEDVPVTDILITGTVIEPGEERITAEWEAYLADLQFRGLTALREIALSVLQNALLN